MVDLQCMETSSDPRFPQISNVCSIVILIVSNYCPLILKIFRGFCDNIGHLYYFKLHTLNELHNFSTVILICCSAHMLCTSLYCLHGNNETQCHYLPIQSTLCNVSSSLFGSEHLSQTQLQENKKLACQGDNQPKFIHILSPILVPVVALTLSQILIF